MDKKTCLETAGAIITNDRQNDYGAPENNFAIIASYWTTYMRSKKYDVEFHPYDVAIMMAQLKMARMASSPRKADNYVDGAGYLAIASELTDSE